MNAFTTQEHTAFYVRVPDEHLELALDILADVVWRPAFRPDEVESERQVILEEIGMRDDTPDDLVHELFDAALFPDHPLGRDRCSARATRSSAMPRDAIARVPRARTTARATSWSRRRATSTHEPWSIELRRPRMPDDRRSTGPSGSVTPTVHRPR